MRSQWGQSPLFHRQAIDEGGLMTLDGNEIFCDSNGCRSQDSFEGELSSEDIRIRYHILGWQITDSDGRETHFCPDHS